ncbi:MAG TPA: aminotransferase class IV [Acidimicrobiales bacterium]|nr:aminotransferase class IV [Acidimicrobiales bacterium]
MRSVWIDGRLCAEAEARVSPFDHGLLTGDGVFETLMVYRGRPFAVRRHLQRLVRSCLGLRLPCPDPTVLRAAIDAVTEANHLHDGRLRITVTGGVAPLGSERGPDGPTVMVAGGPLGTWPPAEDVAVVPWPRNERGALSGLKTTSYGENVLALAYARERKAGEAVFANTQGRLCEGTGTNVFVGVGGRLLTPPLASGCLAGVTRALVLETAGAVEEDLPLSALAAADEAFLTSTTREVQPIRSVDGSCLPSPVPGPLTEHARAAFRSLVERDLDP